MKRIMFCISLLGITIAAGCAGSSKPVIDPAGIDMEQYNADLAECEQIAEQVDQKAGEGAAGGAVVGGLIQLNWGQIPIFSNIPSNCPIHSPLIGGRPRFNGLAWRFSIRSTLSLKFSLPSTNSRFVAKRITSS